MPHLQEKGEEENAPPTQNSTPRLHSPGLEGKQTLREAKIAGPWWQRSTSPGMRREVLRRREGLGADAPSPSHGARGHCTAACPREDVACHPSPEPRSCAHTCSLTRKLFPENPHVSERALKRQI